MPANDQIKRFGKNFLKNRWGKALVILAVIVSASLVMSTLEQILRLVLDIPMQVPAAEGQGWVFNASLPSMIITAARILIGFLVTAPLSLGVVRWFWDVTADIDAPVADVFRDYASADAFFKSIGFYLNMNIRMTLYAILFTFPGFIGALLAFPEVQDLIGVAFPVETVELITALAAVYLILSIVFLIPVLARYFFAAMIYASENSTANEAIRKSILVSKGRKGRIVTFVFSFAGWALFCVFAIPYLYFYPYYVSSKAVFVHCALFEYNQGQKIE